MSLELLYFGIKGRAEPSRLALAVGGVEFKDDHVAFADWPALKTCGKLPFGQVPLLTLPSGVSYTQSDAILRYCGRLGGLYPRDDDVLALAIDEALGAVNDLHQAVFAYRGKDEELSKAARKEFLDVSLPKFAGGLEGIVKAKATSAGWMCGDAVSIADLSLYYVIGNIRAGQVDYVPKDSFDVYPRLMASYNAVLEHEKVKAWNADHPWKTAEPKTL